MTLSDRPQSPSEDFRAALAFLTPLGGRQAAPPTPATMAYFPVVGASLGAVIGLSWWAARRRLPSLPAAALVVAMDALMTGGLHLDGLADTADGLCAHVPAKSRLDIMAEPQVGTFAVVALGVTLLSRTAALAALEPSPALLAALYCSSRSVMVIASRALPYARGEGLATAFLPEPAGPDGALVAGIAGAGAALLVAALAGGRRGARAVVAGWVFGALVLVLAGRRIGGFTGDVLGASGVVCETAGLVVAAAK
jgi:adenosylcobinamide-GDP ribazoletransferase